MGFLTGWVDLSRSWVWLRRERAIDSRRATLRRPKSVAGAQWHRRFLRLNVAFIPHAYNQGRDHWELGSGKDEPPWPGAHNQLAVHPSLPLRICIRTVCLWPLFDGIPFDHWNRFYHQDTTPSLQARRVGDSPDLGPSPAPHQVSFLLSPPSLTRP